MGRKYEYDYIVIGSGPAGVAAALGLATGRKRVAIVEGGRLGGARVNTRDIPYSIALDFAYRYARFSATPEFGQQDISFSFPTLVSRQLKAIARASASVKSQLETAGVTYLDGYAHFLDPHTIAVGEVQHTSAEFILATGATLKATEISGLDSVNYLTPDTAIRTRRLPKAVFVVGGGATGCEIAEYFASLGTKVLIAETAERILPREDKEVGVTITDYFTTELGITVLPSSKVIALEQDDLSKKVIFQAGRTQKVVRVDCIVLATGSQPAIDCGLDNAGVKYLPTGIKVNKYFETSTKTIYAVGDCTGADSSTERAEYEGALLASNIINKTNNTPNYHGFIRITDTYPQVATVGFTEDDLIRRDRKYQKSLMPLSQSIAGTVHSVDYGFVKLLADKQAHRILGATIVAPSASLMAEELALAIRYGITLPELAGTPHVADSLSYTVRLAAKDLVLRKK